MKRLFLTCALVLSIHQAQALEMNDLSILLPLPQSQSDKAELLQPSTLGLGGELLAKEIYAKVPSLVFGENRGTRAKNVFALGIRIDPCFQEGQAPQGCLKQIRIVWQPVTESLSTIDAAYHTFYQLTDQQFSSLVKELTALAQQRTNQAGEALYVHPTIAEQGLAGPYWNKLRNLVLRYAGAENLTRLTVMTVSRTNVRTGKAWTFEGINIKKTGRNFNTERIQMHKSDDFFQGFTLRGSSLEKFNYRFVPAFSGANIVKSFLANSDAFKRNADTVKMVKLAREVVVLANPTLNNPGTADCMSCHFAKSIEDDLTKHDRLLMQDPALKEQTYASTYNLTNRTPVTVTANNLRAFGYFQSQPILSQRVINETAAILRNLALPQ